MRYRTLRIILVAIFVGIGLAACSSSEEGSNASYYSDNQLYSYAPEDGNLWDNMRQNLNMPTYAYRPEVRQWIVFFQEHPAYFDRVLVDSAPYIYYIYQQTQRRHLPAELALIPIIESEYNPNACSHVGAIGLWQMMPTTARNLGLKRDWWYDGRKDIFASTNAALDYFSYLHSYFNNDWLLGIAAYDCGQGTVAMVMRYNREHGYGTDFWDLPLPSETQNYVPRLLAVAAIIKSPSTYHMQLPPINDSPYIAQVNVGKCMSLNQAAQMANVPLATMKQLNPDLSHGKMDPHGPYTILVPVAQADTFEEKMVAFSQNEKLAWQKHIVQSRETLAKIATRYKTNIALLRQVNDLDSDVIHTNETILIPPANSNGTTPPASDNTTVAANTDNTVNINSTSTDASASTNTSDVSSNNTTSTTDNASSNSTDTTTTTTVDNSSQQATAAADTTATTNNTYTVVAGDDLNKIAAKLNTTVAQIKTDNQLHSNLLKIGQVLQITNANQPQLASNDDSKTTATPNSADKKIHHHKKATHSNTIARTEKSNKIIYTVRNGDYLNKIAKRFGVSADNIRQWNKLSNDDILQPGQKIVINPDA